MNLKSKIDEIKNLLEDSGWCKGTLQNFDGERCLLGATDFIGLGFGLKSSDDVVDVDVVEELETAVGKAIARTKRKKFHEDDCRIFIANWNDKPNRKFSEVLKVLELAKKYL